MEILFNFILLQRGGSYISPAEDYWSTLAIIIIFSIVIIGTIISAITKKTKEAFKTYTPEELLSKNNAKIISDNLEGLRPISEDIDFAKKMINGYHPFEDKKYWEYKLENAYQRKVAFLESKGYVFDKPKADK